MTAQINLEEVYNELNNLLLDVCSFLNTEVQNGTLSAAAKNQAEKLLYRSKKQVEVISTISILQESTNSNYPYLQMQGPGLMEEPLSEYVDPDGTNHYEAEDYEENYVEVGTESISLPPPSSMIVEDLCPFTELPLSVMSEKAVKFGPLVKKERYFIIEQKKQLLVGLVGYWLLIYCANKKDVKPIQILNLTDYTARAVEQKKDPIFEIVSNSKKTYEFIAKSVKDMDQWIVAINCKKQLNINGRNLPDIPLAPKNSNEDITDNSDKIINNNTNNIISVSDDFDSEQDIYENLDDIRKNDAIPPINSEIEEKTPKLPARQHIHFTKNVNRSSTANSTYNNVPTISNTIEENEEDNNYDPVQNSSIEEDEDEIYDVPKVVETSNKHVKITTVDYDNEDDEDCSYDIPRNDISQNQTIQANNTYDEDEDVEYDELKIISPKIEDKKNNLRIDTTQEKIKNLPKPIITSPKPKLQSRLDKLTSFSKKSDNSDGSQQEGSNSKRIHNIIQQMEASLNFKGNKN